MTCCTRCVLTWAVAAFLNLQKGGFFMENTTINTEAQSPHVKRTPEERAEHRRQYLKTYMQQYRANNSDKTLAWRIQAAKNLLQREGYSVTPDPTKDGDGEA